MSRHRDRPGGDDEPEPVVGIDLVQPAGLPGEPLGEPGRVIGQRVLVADLGQDPHDLLGRAGEVADDLWELGQLRLEPVLAEPFQLRGQPGAQGVKPPLLLRGRVDGHDQCPGPRSCFHRPGEGLLDVPAPRRCHAAGEALQLEGVGAVLAGEVAVAAFVAAAAIDPVGLPQPAQQNRDHVLVLTGREALEVNFWHHTTMPEESPMPGPITNAGGAAGRRQDEVGRPVASDCPEAPSASRREQPRCGSPVSAVGYLPDHLADPVLSSYPQQVPVETGPRQPSGGTDGPGHPDRDRGHAVGFVGAVEPFLLAHTGPALVYPAPRVGLVTRRLASDPTEG